MSTPEPPSGPPAEAGGTGTPEPGHRARALAASLLGELTGQRKTGLTFAPLEPSGLAVTPRSDAGSAPTSPPDPAAPAPTTDDERSGAGSGAGGVPTLQPEPPRLTVAPEPQDREDDRTVDGAEDDATGAPLQAASPAPSAPRVTEVPSAPRPAVPQPVPAAPQGAQSAPAPQSASAPPPAPQQQGPQQQGSPQQGSPQPSPQQPSPQQQGPQQQGPQQQGSQQQAPAAPRPAAAPGVTPAAATSAPSASAALAPSVAPSAPARPQQQQQEGGSTPAQDVRPAPFAYLAVSQHHTTPARATADGALDQAGQRISSRVDRGLVRRAALVTMEAASLLDACDVLDGRARAADATWNGDHHSPTEVREFEGAWGAFYDAQGALAQHVAG